MFDDAVHSTAFQLGIANNSGKANHQKQIYFKHMGSVVRNYTLKLNTFPKHLNCIVFIHQEE
jgi:hypothetical protein